MFVKFLKKLKVCDCYIYFFKPKSNFYPKFKTLKPGRVNFICHRSDKESNR